ncbi:MAG: hypothetical protein EPN79_02175 [Burkholderiaceae bacterium]|nr:MAG: hypothetical protein EPN79_02175 [Burkholderiaceae bacterium]TBR76157.1 MAG: hypothetical protein EPN64_09100 [Burkholderiaceae bacterium]
MNKTEAQEFLGRMVSAWTAANGTYVGTLIEVVAAKGRPWRGRVRITGVLTIACHWEIGCSGPIRKGFRPDDEIEVGGLNIKPCEHEGTTYLAALEASNDELRGWIGSDPDGQRDQTWSFQKLLTAQQEVLRREIEAAALP